MDVRRRAHELGLPPLGDISILPRGFATAATQGELRHESDASTLRKLLIEAGVPVQQLEPSDHLPIVVQKGADWLAPTIFVGSMLMTQNPYAIQIALGVVESYITDFLKARLPTGRLRLSFVVEIETAESKSFKRFDYDGPVAGIKDIAPLLKKLHDE